MNWNNIWSLQAMDGQAASIVSQAGCVDEMSLADKSDCLLRAIQQRQSQLVHISENHPDRKRLGRELQEIELMKSAINKEIKAAKIKASISIDERILQECKKILTGEQWQAVVAIAKRTHHGVAV